MQFWALIIDSFRESIDRKIFWVMAAISLLMVAAMVCIGFETDRITFFFGVWEVETSHFDPFSGLGRSRIVGLVVYVLMDLFLGWIGVILMIIATASVFPAMMQRGAIDVLLSKPITRPKIFLFKYLASMVFVLLQAILFVGLTFLVMGFHWKVWVPGYLLSIPLLVLLFSYVYCVSVLVAVKTRSTVAAILLSIGVWFAYACPVMALHVFEEFPDLQEHKQLYRAVRVASWIPPKTADIPYLAARWASAGTSVDVFPSSVTDGGREEYRRQFDRARELEQRELEKSPWTSIGSSLLFEAVIVLWAMWLFSRKDY